MATNFNQLHAMLGVTPGPNGGFGVSSNVGRPTPRVASAFSGEADVMMISGIDKPPAASGADSPSIPTPSLWGQLNTPVTIGALTYPLYAWLLAAAALGGFGGYYLGRR